MAFRAKFQNDQDTIENSFGPGGEIRVYISSTKYGQVYITANIQELCTYSATINFKHPCFNSLSWEIINDSIQADGVELAEFLLKTDPMEINQNQLVQLHLSPLGSFFNGNPTLDLNFDINGEVRIFIRSSQQGVSQLNASINNM